MTKIHLPPEHFAKVCRVCLSEYSPLISIAEISLTHNLKPNGKVENVSLISIFERFCDVKVKPDDKKPQKICEFCIDMSCKAFNYFQLFIYSDTLLNRKLRRQDLEQPNPNTKSKDKSTTRYVKAKDTPVISSSSATSEIVTSEIDGYEDTTVAEDTAVLKDAVVLNGTVGLDGTIYFEDHEGANEAEVTDDKMIPENAAVNAQIIAEEDISLTLPPVEHIKHEMEEVLSVQKTRKRRRSIISEMSFHQLDTLQKGALQMLMSFKNKHILKQPKLQKMQQSLGTLGHMKDIFKCRFCKKTFHGIDKVMAHMDDEPESWRRCMLCPRQFRDRIHIKYHVATHSSNSLICKICHLFFETKEEFDQHFELLDHTNNKKCPKCEKTYRVPYLLRKHIEAFHLKKYKFQCKHCGKMFRYQASMSRHEHNTHGSKKFLCQVCAKSFSTHYALKVHMQKIHKIQQELIIKKYAIKKKPQNKDNNRKPRVPRPPQYKCKFCDKEFDKPSLFYQHSQAHPEFDEYKCLLCPHVLNTKKEHDDHYETHKTFKCRNETCPKMFTTKMGALAHSYTHNKRFKCETCHRSFAARVALRNHMNVHTGEKPYICEKCGQGFKQTTHLKVHVAVQHQDHGKPWQCHLCDKAFSYNNTLKIHMRSHTGHKPFTCLYCDKVFRDTTGRHKHIKKDHPEKMEEFLVYKENYQEHEKQQIIEKFPEIE